MKGANITREWAEFVELDAEMWHILFDMLPGLRKCEYIETRNDYLDDVARDIVDRLIELSGKVKVREKPASKKENTMRDKNKYEYLWIVQGKYGHHGWEDVSACETWKECREDLMAYRENEPEYPHRAIQRRELA